MNEGGEVALITRLDLDSLLDDYWMADLLDRSYIGFVEDLIRCERITNPILMKWAREWAQMRVSEL